MPALATLVDAFPGPALDPAWVANGAGIIAGQLYVNATHNAGAPDYSSARRTGFTFTGSQLVAEVVAMPSATGGGAAFAQLWVQDPTPAAVVDRLGFEYVAATNTLDCLGQTGAGYAPIGATTSLTYDPVAMRWLRLRHTGTTIVWETSPDGLTWTARRTMTTGLPAWAGETDTLQVSIEAYRTAGVNDTLRVASLNRTVAAIPTTPPTGADAYQRRVLSELRTWKAWLTANGAARGYVGEYGGVTVAGQYGDPVEQGKWDALHEAYSTELDVQALSGTAWASGREWGNGYPLGIHVGTAVGDPLSIVQQGAGGIIAAHPTRGAGAATRWRGVNLSGWEQGVGIQGGGTVRSGPGYLHTTPDFELLAANGVDLIRLPFAWERIQPTLGGALDAAALTALDGMLTAARQVGIRVILDLHNYGYFTQANGTTVVSLGNGITNAQLSDVWTKISTWVKAVTARNQTVVGYGLMNEPNTLTGGAAAWETSSQAALTAIRGNADTRLILVAGYTFSSLVEWATWHPDGWITDSANNFAYEAHHYWDLTSALGARSGTYQQSATGPITTYALEVAASATSEYLGPTDAFSTGLANWPGSYGGVTVQGGQLRLPSNAVPAYAGAEVTTTQTLNGRVFLVEVPQVAALLGATVGAYTSLWIGSASGGLADGDRAGWGYDAVTGQLRAQLQDGYDDPAPVALPYDPVAHRWWRLDQTTGQLRWQTSPDGRTWTTRRTVTTPPAWTGLADQMIALESYRENGASGFALFDNANNPPAQNPPITLTGLAPATVIGAVAVKPSPMTVPLPGVPSEVLGSSVHTLLPGPVTVSVPSITGDPDDLDPVVVGGSPTLARIGTPRIARVAVVPSVPPATTIGTPTVAVGPVTIAAPTAGAAAQLGDVAVRVGTVSLQPAGLATQTAIGTIDTVEHPITRPIPAVPPGTAIGAPALLPQRVLITPAGLTDSSIGTPTLLPQPITVQAPSLGVVTRFGALNVQKLVQPLGLAPADRIGAPTVRLRPTPVPLQSVTGTQIGAPTFTVGPITVTLRPAKVDTRIGDVRHRAGPVTITTTGIEPASAAGVPEIVLVPWPIHLAGIRDTAIGAPTVAPQPVIVELAGRLPGTIGDPQVTPRAVVVQPAGLAPEGSVGGPAVEVGPVTVGLASVAIDARLGRHRLRPGPAAIAPTGSEPATQIGAPALATGPATVAAAGAPRATRIGTPTVATGPATVQVAAALDGARIGTPTVTARPVAITATPVTGTQIGAPTVTAAAVTVTAPAVAEATRIPVPVVRRVPAGTTTTRPRPGAMAATASGAGLDAYDAQEARR